MDNQVLTYLEFTLKYLSTDYVMLLYLWIKPVVLDLGFMLKSHGALLKNTDISMPPPKIPI